MRGKTSPPIPSAGAVFLTVFAGFLLATGYWYYLSESEHIRKAKYEEIAGIAAVKIGDIVLWRKERMGDAIAVAGSPFFRKATEEWLATPERADLRALLKERLRVDQEAYGYSEVSLIDLSGKVLLSAGGDETPLSPAVLLAMKTARRSRKAVLSELYRGSNGKVYIDAVAVLRDEQEHPLAAVALRMEAKNHLFPLISAWPTPSPSAETLLVRLDGDDILFLNELRHRQQTALEFRLPVTRGDLPALRAIFGQVGMFHGTDYRGVEVLADLRPVPGSSWAMVAKVDAAEILHEVRYRAGIVFLLGVLLLSLGGAVLAFIYRHREAGLYRALYGEERKKREAEENYRAILYSIGDGVIVTDTRGLVRRMNPVAEELTGWSESESAGKPVEEVFRIIREDTRKTVESPVARVLREGVVVGLANHTLLVSKDGMERPIADSGAPVRTADGMMGVVLVFRDQTQERNAAKALHESEQRFRTLVEQSPAAIFVQTQGKFAYVNDAGLYLFGADSENDLVGTPVLERFAPEHRDQVRERIRTLNEQRKRVPMLEERLLKLDGTPMDVDVSAVPFVFDGENGALVFMTDITERKRARNILRESLEEKTALLKEIHHRVKNNLQIVVSLLGLQSRKLKDPAFIAALQDTRDRVSSMALLHELLYTSENLSRIDLPKYVKELCGHLKRSFGSTAACVNLENQVAPLTLPLDQAVPCGLILSELISNALKHGFPDGRAGTVTVEVGPTDNHSLFLSVRDDGVGLSPKQGDHRDSSLGLRLVENLTAQLRGHLTTEEPDGPGIVFRIEFPLPVELKNEADS